MKVVARTLHIFFPSSGYARILFCAVSYYYCFSDPVVSMVFYALGQGMDAIDGVAARYFNQVSSLGAMLDMLTDRMGTAVLFIILSHLYTSFWGFFAFLIVLDLVSHWMQMYASLSSGKKTHKGSVNPLLNFYYTFPYALLVFCVGNEAFIICMYLMAYFESSLVTTVAVISLPVFIAKQFMNFVQLYDCCQTLTITDASNANNATKSE